jgi:conjugal transfer pilus assembly protein TraW
MIFLCQINHKKNIIVSILALLSFFYSKNLLAKDLGQFGPVFEIKEPDLLELIYTTLQSYESNGQLENHQQNIAKKIKQSIVNPAPVRGISKVVTHKVRYYDPTITLVEDIKDSNGNLIASMGTKVNPLDHADFNEEWIFVDGNDKEQLRLAHNFVEEKEEKTKIAKIVLVAGSPGSKKEEDKEYFYYFDQFGKYCQKFGINQVPAILRQKNHLIEIEEVVVK